MQQPDPSSSPAGSDRARRRGIFAKVLSKTDSPPLDAESEALVTAYQQLVMDRLEQGLRDIRQEATVLMHEIASEVWRTSGGRKGEVQATILEAISRDQALRGLIAHSDERFQALSIRTERLEDTLNQVAEQTRAAREALAGAGSLADATGSTPLPEDPDLRRQLRRVTHQIAVAFETLAERDRLIVETIRERVEQHGEIVSQETGRIAQAMQTYVQEGVSVLGHLAGRIESQVEETGDDEVAERMRAVIQRQTQLLGEQLQLLFDRTGVATDELNRSVEHLTRRNDERANYLGEHLQLMHDRIGMESRDLVEAINGAEGRTRELLESRVRGLGELVRSDSEALREELIRTAVAQDEAVAQRLEASLGRVSEALTSAVRWLVEELTRRLRDETGAAIQSRLDEAVVTIDRNLVRMTDTLETELDRLGRTVGEQAAQAAEGALSDKLDQKIAALAKMIRSDNQALAERVQVAAEQDASKQALRAVKELEANLPAEVLEIVDQRMQELAESVAKLGDLLERKVDQATAQMSRRYDSDIQNVVDRIGDAMHALASLGRSDPDHIDLE